MEEDNRVTGEGWISDESSFYGDEDERSYQMDLCQTFSPDHFWSTAHKNLNMIARTARLRQEVGATPNKDTFPTKSMLLSAAAYSPSIFADSDRKTIELERLGKRKRELSPERRRKQSPKSFSPSHELFNPRAGCHDSWQLGESVDDFVMRLPPLTTPVFTCEWIWVVNPHRSSQDTPTYPSVDEFRSRGTDLLGRSLNTRNQIRARCRHGPKAMLGQLLNEESKALQQSIVNLAVENDILSGKWMLFPGLKDVTRVWKLVVQGVINGRLGPTAKIAPDDGKEERLIYVYTQDFRHESDVLRVLEELDNMGLLTPGRSIYYKSDAYTYLDIYKNTASEFGLQASLYDSWKMMAKGTISKSTSTMRDKRPKINQFY